MDFPPLFVFACTPPGLNQNRARIFKKQPTAQPLPEKK
jgi:hypothetical protein